MAQIGISITKSTAFRNSTQEFSNVYYYTGGSTPSASQADQLIDELTAMEKAFHSNIVTFVRGRLWSAGGTQAQNNMISQKNLSGTGSTGTASSLDKERAFLFRLRAGNSSNGQPVFLRKWFHACGIFYTGQTLASGVIDNTTSFLQTQRDSMVANMNGIGALNAAAGPWKLCAKSGRLPDAGALWTSHPYLEHHQLGDQWRSL